MLLAAARPRDCAAVQAAMESYTLRGNLDSYSLSDVVLGVALDGIIVELASGKFVRRASSWFVADTSRMTSLTSTSCPAAARPAGRGP